MDKKYEPRDEPRTHQPPAAYREIGTRGGRMGTPNFRGGRMGNPNFRGGGRNNHGWRGRMQHPPGAGPHDRPGYFAAESSNRNGNYQQPFHHNDQVERDRINHQRQQMRDTRNRPHGIAEKFDHH